MQTLDLGQLGMYQATPQHLFFLVFNNSVTQVVSCILKQQTIKVSQFSSDPESSSDTPLKNITVFLSFNSNHLGKTKCFPNQKLILGT